MKEDIRTCDTCNEETNINTCWVGENEYWCGDECVPKWKWIEILYSVLDRGRECETKEEYIELVKDYFREEHNLEILDSEISDIESEEIL
jgi:hypothetical protein